MQALRKTVLALALVAFTLIACDNVTTQAPQDGDVFDAPIEGLTPAELAAFARGDAEFERRFAPNSGLGPIFNNASCASCHSGDGRGVLDNALQRIGSELDDFLGPLGGPQIQDKAIPGADPERLPAGAEVSTRLPPPVFGVGLMEAIPDAAILALADPDDRNGDGISGRANMVRASDFVPGTEPGGGSGMKVGRFGRKAQTSSLFQQVVDAYHQDIGITSDFRLAENRNPLSSVPVEALDVVADPEIPVGTVQAVTHYIRALAPPAPGEDTPDVRDGAALFTQVSCASCHVPSLRTGTSVLPALSNVEVRMYSDLLLHDMGDALADRRPDGSANGREWRTPPLWGLRLMGKFLDGQGLLLHDGRARTVAEAILMHGGEAARARQLFTALSDDQKRKLLAFVESR